MSEFEKHALAGSKLLRFLCYCERSDMSPPAGAGKDWSVLKMGYHHAKMSLTIYLSENGLDIDQGRVCKAYQPFKGCIIVSPPGHGKTVIACGWIAQHLAENVQSQGSYLHAVKDEAIKNVTKTGSYFKLDNSTGERFRTLYPNIRLDPKAKAASIIRLQSEHRTKDPNLQGSGVMVKPLGRNNDFQVWDDVVPQSDIHEEEVRKRRHKQLTGSWLSRMRGEHTFLLVIANMWHLDDAVSRLMKDSQKNRMQPLVLSVGGPDTNPKFRSIWPDMYPPSELKTRYETMRDHALWSAAYMANPVAESMRLVRELRFYDPREESHKTFLDTATFHYSIDPTATNKPDADMAGSIYAAHGDFQVVNGETIETYKTLRILDADQYHANQLELAQKCKEFAEIRSVDFLHVETRSGFHATADLLQMMTGSENVIRHDPGNQNKGLRLKNAAGWMDESACRTSGCMASVEFPGMRLADGTLGPDPKWNWLYDQILKFGVVTEDHCFPGWVLVQTNRGNIPIHTVRAGDMALTRKGWKRVLRAWCTGNREVITRFGITATPEHRIWTENRGWTILSSVNEHDTLLVCKESHDHQKSQEKQLSSTDGSITDGPNPKTEVCGFTIRPILTATRHHEDCTETCGSSIMDRSQAERSFTTKTEILSTTTSQILNCSHLNPRICKSMLENLENEVEAGSNSKISQSKEKHEQNQFMCAPSAKRNTWHSKPDEIDTAIHAEKLPCEKPCRSGEKQTENLLGSVGAKHTTETSISANVLVPTYDLMIEDEHEFFADGVLVHNCLDAITQLVNYLARMGDLPKMEGVITSAIQAQAMETGDPRCRAYINSLLTQNKHGRDVAVEDYSFLAGEHLEENELSWN